MGAFLGGLARIALIVFFIIAIIWGVTKFFNAIGQEDEVAVPVQVTNTDEIAVAVVDEMENRQSSSTGDTGTTVVTDSTADGGSDTLVINSWRTTDTQTFPVSAEQGQVVFVKGETVEFDGESHSNYYRVFEGPFNKDLTITNGAVYVLRDGDAAQKCVCQQYTEDKSDREVGNLTVPSSWGENVCSKEQ